MSNTPDLSYQLNMLYPANEYRLERKLECGLLNDSTVA